MSLYSPLMTAGLTYSNAVDCIDDFLLLRLEYLDDQSGQGEEQPLDRYPPPADEDPPRAAVALVFKMYIVDSLDIDICTVTSWANNVWLLLSYRGNRDGRYSGLYNNWL